MAKRSRSPVEWSDQAEEEFWQNVEWLAQRFGPGTASAFMDRSEIYIKTISHSPTAFPSVEKGRSIRKCVVVPQIILYFQQFPDKIELLSFFNTHQDPTKLKL